MEVSKNMNDTKILLGKKSIWYYIQLCLVTPLWAMSVSPTRKSWSAFKDGMISHKCEFKEELSYDEKYPQYPYRECKHHGCNMIDPILNLKSHN